MIRRHKMNQDASLWWGTFEPALFHTQPPEPRRVKPNTRYTRGHVDGFCARSLKPATRVKCGQKSGAS
ncbi:hypothetical protein T484DRAFT_2352539 [Baffinella frigidus]|nr:hypothetical protein T484DRAFT_2352539 [Cryptophyta sp. CCMP2293]